MALTWQWQQQCYDNSTTTKQTETPIKHHACFVPASTRLSQSLINGPASTQRHRACTVPALINEIAIPSPRVDTEAHPDAFRAQLPRRAFAVKLWVDGHRLPVEFGDVKARAPPVGQPTEREGSHFLFQKNSTPRRRIQVQRPHERRRCAPMGQPVCSVEFHRKVRAWVWEGLIPIVKVVVM